jgi:phage regulator Rha-like protein
MLIPGGITKGFTDREQDMIQMTTQVMKPRLLIKGEDVRTTSLAVADAFGKRHINVFRGVEDPLKFESSREYEWTHPLNSEGIRL